MTFLVASLIAISSLVGLLGCSIPSKEEGSANSRQVVIPWWSETSYKWEAVPLLTLKNLSDLEGSAAKFFMHPSASGNGKTLMGTQPRIRYFVNQQGSAVMTDELSQHLVTLYAHMEKLQQMDSRLGLGNVLRKPRAIGVSTVPTVNGANNALYSPKYDSLLFLPYSGKDLPIIVNAGAIAHEHFHSLFQALLADEVQSKVDTMAFVAHTEDRIFKTAFELGESDKVTTELEERARYHSFLLRAINEGLADAWALIYTGDPNFVQKTWTKLTERNMDPATESISSREEIRAVGLRATERGQEDPSLAYQLGTRYARVLSTIYGKAKDREAAAPKIVALLKDLKLEILGLKEEDWLSPSIVVGLLSKHADTKGDCEKFLSFAKISELDAAVYNCNRFPAPVSSP